MFPKIGQFKKSKPDNWKPGTFSGKTSWGTNPNAAVVGNSPSPKKSTYLTESQAQTRRNTEKSTSNSRLAAKPGGLGSVGSSASWTDTNPGYDLMH